MGYLFQGHSSHGAFISRGIHPTGFSSLGGFILGRFIPGGFVPGDCVRGKQGCYKSPLQTIYTFSFLHASRCGSCILPMCNDLRLWVCVACLRRIIICQVIIFIIIIPQRLDTVTLTQCFLCLLALSNIHYGVHIIHLFFFNPLISSHNYYPIYYPLLSRFASHIPHIPHIIHFNPCVSSVISIVIENRKHIYSSHHSQSIVSEDWNCFKIRNE